MYDQTYTEDVVIKSSAGEVAILRSVGSLEVQSLQGKLEIVKPVQKHVDVKYIGKSGKLSLDQCNMDFWVGDNCGHIESFCYQETDWGDYINSTCGGTY